MQSRNHNQPIFPTWLAHAYGLGCAATVLAFAYWAGYGPLTAWRQENIQRLAVLHEKIAEGPSIREAHRSQALELQSLLTRVQEVNRRVPDDPNEGEFLADLSRLAKEHDVNISDFRSVPTPSSAEHSCLCISLTGEGTHADISRFLDETQQLDRLVQLRKLNIDPRGDGEMLPFRLEYALYYGLAPSS